MKTFDSPQFPAARQASRKIYKGIAENALLDEKSSMTLTTPVVFEPLAMERVWGGRRLETLYGKSLPQGAPIGESWEIVDREDAQSVVHSGPLRGLTLHELWTTHRGEIFGAAYANHEARHFPILIKLLDARERLSVQVHPPASMASTLRGEPKTEMWYFADTLPAANIYAGLKSGVTREHFESLLRIGRVEEALHVISVEPGDSIFIPSGRLHAIGEGNVIVEVQQNSDTTYRVFDWNRTGLDGQPRKLHIEESLVATDFQDFEPSTEQIEEGVLAECPYFKVEKLSLNAPRPACSDGKFAIYNVLSGGAGCAGATFQPGDFFLVPACLSEALLTATAENTKLLRSTLPTE